MSMHTAAQTVHMHVIGCVAGAHLVQLVQVSEPCSLGAVAGAPTFDRASLGRRAL